MAEFRFPLQSVLQLRQLELDQRDAELLQVISELNRLNQVLADVERQLQQVAEQVVQLQTEVTLNVHVLRRVAAEQDRLQQRQAQLQLEQRSCQSRRDHCRVSRQQAESNLLALENLRDRQLAEWKKQATRTSQLQLEDNWLVRRRKAS